MSSSKEVVQYKEVSWEEIDPYKFEVSAKFSKTSDTGIPYTYREIYYVDGGKKYFISFNDIPAKMSRIIQSKYGYGVTIIFNADHIAKDEDRIERQKLINRFIEWYIKVHNIIMIKVAINEESLKIESPDESKFYGKTIDKILSDKRLMKIDVLNTEKKKCKISRKVNVIDGKNVIDENSSYTMFLPLNNKDPFETDPKRRTGFKDIAKKLNQKDIITKLMNVPSEAVRLIRIDRINKDDAIQQRFIAATILKFLQPDVFEKQKIVKEQYTSSESIEEFERSIEETKNFNEVDIKEKTLLDEEEIVKDDRPKNPLGKNSRFDIDN